MESVKSARLSGVEVRCPNVVLKNYDGVKKAKTCGALNLVVNSSPGGVDLSVKCRSCGQMIRHVVE